MHPQVNKLLSKKDVGVVQITCGRMHAVALTRNNIILTWGVNDHSALGRALNVKEDEDDELNPAESTPGPVDISGLQPKPQWVQIAASDNVSFALTDDGKVYGWETFGVNFAPQTLNGFRLKSMTISLS
jgi:regulator of chromosome condensation